jgi:hypothetical protein
LYDYIPIIGDYALMITPLLLALLCVGLSLPAHADDRYPALEKMGPQAVSHINDLMNWQLSFEGMSETDLVKKMGTPDATESLGSNPVTQKPMHNLIYSISEYSNISFTIHEGHVNAVALVLVH